MKNIIWIVLALLAICIVIPATRCKSHNAELTAESDEAFMVVEETPGNDIGETAGTDARDTAEVTDSEDEPYMDTLLMVGGKALGFMGTDDYMRYAVAYDLKPIMDDPTASFDSISPMIYAVDLVGRKQKFNLGNASCVKKIKAFNRPIQGFRRYDRKFEMAPDSAAPRNYFFTLDYPEDSLPCRDEISKWLVGLVEATQDIYLEMKPFTSKDYVARYKGSATNLDKLSKYASKMWWTSIKEEYDDDFPPPLYFIADYRARIHNERFVTYRMYINSYLGGAHGMYTENLVSYDLVNHRPIDNEYLFRKGTLEKVTDLLCEAISKNEKFRSWNGRIETAEEVKRRIEGWNDEETKDETDTYLPPQAALTDEGLVFSFQPYEIDCFAAGCYHILIPYKKVKPYMNKHVVNTLGI